MMKDKKGFLLAEETLKIILAVISIGVLVYLLTALYTPGQTSQELEFAEASLDRLVSEINVENEEVTIYNPEGWWILSEKVRGELCICEESDYLSCREEGVCEDSEFRLDESIEIKDAPMGLVIDYQNKIISKN